MPKRDKPAEKLRPDKLVHEPMRFAVMAALNPSARLSFAELKRKLGSTDGNLSVHARKLEDGGYISCAKSFDGRVPRTEYALTAAGRKAFERYLKQMDQIVRAARAAVGRSRP